MASETATFKLITADDLLKHWQEHRRLTRKVIEAFPDDKLFQFSVGGMRTFGELACEFLGMTIPVVDGVATGRWGEFKFAKPTTKADLLSMWDEQTVQLNEKFPAITEARFHEVEKAFGQWEMPGLTMVEYAIETEIHPRGQGYVYLRALGIEPPMFYDRS
jgi:uncharacterized damage-inducible protein DinB